MSKFLFVLICFFLFQPTLRADSSYNFEAELKALENRELEDFENKMKAVEKISAEMIEDSVSQGLAAPIRTSPQDKTPPLTEESLKSPTRIRRIRSR